MELMSILWKVFVETGDIEAYLLYKSISEKGQETGVWEPSEKMVLS
ncbi:MAG: YqzL family protein [Clostridia bacterium]|nr:YqzL family protein [Clostridia bacterium]